MAQITLPAFLEEDFLALIPEHRVYIDQLMNDGIITSYSLALDRSTVWITFNSKSEKAVNKIINSFPISHFIEFDVLELAFHNSATVFFPSLSLN
ncbi:MAG: hypothetical protein ACKVOU_09190 [Cytophagales bacterium]